MKLPSRNIVSLLLTVVYLLVVMSPFAPLALKSPRLAHAITGECSGDCDICGCSPERRAGQTCCCWQKKARQLHEQEEANLPPCCKKEKHAGGPVLSCGCPCGSGAHIGIWGGGTMEQLPYRFIAGMPNPPEGILAVLYSGRPADRCGDPPDPPPKLSIVS